MLYDVIIRSKSSYLDEIYTYEFEGDIERGCRVIVPFGRGNSQKLGIVISDNVNNMNIKTKKILKVLDSKSLISDDLINTALYMVKNNISDYSSAFATILPPGSIESITEYYYCEGNIEGELFKYLSEPRKYEEIASVFKNKYSKTMLNKLVDEGSISKYVDFNKKASEKYIEYFEIIDSDFECKIRKNSTKQLEVLKYLKERGKVDKIDIYSKFGNISSILNNLSEKQIILKTKKRIFRNVLNTDFEKYYSHTLNEEQQRAFEEIIYSDNLQFLLKGVTGSGKTEVYLQIVKRYLELGKEAIILVPEISLTPQTIARFRGRFGNDIAVLHSRLSISERADQWKLIKNKEVKIVVGVRSAIFAPFDNLGIIIIDEEHEDSYKSDKNPKYNAIDIAFFRAEQQNCKVLLGTATPSLATMYKVERKKINMLNIEKRANSSNMPEVHVVDMREELKLNNFTMFSNLLKNKIDKALENRKQSILFLNKRGHTSFVFCRSCGYVHKCEACDVAMTYHKYNDRLICHYCGRTALKSKTCINCGSKWIKEFGAGTEMLEEQTKELFPNAKVFRMDADTVTGKNDYEKVYDKMKSNEIDILIGTQMLAKGLDFPNVTVVGVVSADIGLNIPNFRAAEKTYSLITQVSGRAGRGDSKGDVIIQTYEPEHPAIKYSATNEYFEFYRRELVNRQNFSYPPFFKILNINISSLDREYAIKYARNLILATREFIRNENIELKEMTGPTPSVIERVNNRYRFDIIIKSFNKEILIKISEFLRNQKKDAKVYINFKLEED